jgi:hypothetical protein
LRATQIRFDPDTDAYLGRLEAEWKRAGLPGHVSQSAVVRYALRVAARTIPDTTVIADIRGDT